MKLPSQRQKEYRERLKRSGRKQRIDLLIDTAPWAMLGQLAERWKLSKSRVIEKLLIDAVNADDPVTSTRGEPKFTVKRTGARRVMLVNGEPVATLALANGRYQALDGDGRVIVEADRESELRQAVLVWWWKNIG